MRWPLASCRIVVAVFQHRDFRIRVHAGNQQRLVNILRANVFHGLVGDGRGYVVSSNHETVLGRDPQLECLAIADHVEGRSARRSASARSCAARPAAGQNVTANFLIVGDMALLDAAGGRVDIHGRLQGVDGFSLLVNPVDQPLLRRLLKRRCGVFVLDRAGAKKARGRRQHCQEYDQGPNERENVSCRSKLSPHHWSIQAAQRMRGQPGTLMKVSGTERGQVWPHRS